MELDRNMKELVSTVPSQLSLFDYKCLFIKKYRTRGLSLYDIAPIKWSHLTIVIVKSNECYKY
jgi:hypothetical protein